MTAPHRPRKIVSRAGTTREFIKILARLPEASPADILDVRLILEPQAAAAVVSSASGLDLARIREAHDNAVEAGDLADFEHWDAELHSRIYAATRNELLISLNNLLGNIRGRAPWIRLKKLVITDAKRAEYCAHHQDIVDAISRRDADGASEAMHRHVSIIIEDLFPR